MAHDGEPLTSTNAAGKYIRESGCLVRDHIPISCRLWKFNNPNEQGIVVLEREKELIWYDLKQHFTLLEGSEELVKKWTLKRMATQFQTVKKNLTNTYIKQGKTSKFTREFAKLKDHWDSFLEYKCSELGIQWVRRNKENASKKIYHHTLGQAGYKGAIPKWHKMEVDLLARGITPATIN